jgi:RimJ/RimL family protein N-acetyltransferase
MAELTGKAVALREMNLKEMRAFWRKYESPVGEPKFTYDEERVDLLFEKLESVTSTKMVGIFTKTGEIIGIANFGRIVLSESRCELTLYFANESAKGKGVDIESVNLAKQYAKSVIGLERIYADVSTKNVNLQNVLKECGFVHLKTFKGGMGDGGDRMSFFSRLA